jgi:AraC-like DNA-binding protein
VTGRHPGQFLFRGRRGPDSGLTTRQYARLVSEWIANIRLDPLKFGTHSPETTQLTQYAVYSVCTTAPFELENTDRPVSEVATTLGYRDSNAFSRAFLAWSGLNPRNWRYEH